MFYSNFKRVEKKYLISEFQYAALMHELTKYMHPDEYGKTSILNIYYDTPDFRLIRTSLEKPLYKEKLRVRTYGETIDDTNAFVEIKKKYKGVVYKRRVHVPYRKADEVIQHQAKGEDWDTLEMQISNEINYLVLRYRTLIPQMFLSYDRIALQGTYNPELRITFDKNIRWRTDNLDLRNGNYGTELLQKGQILMEIKIPGAMPLELSKLLSQLKIFSISYSKYGSGYMQYYMNCVLDSREPVNKISSLFIPPAGLTAQTAVFA